MNIGFYGHSASSWYGDERSFIDQIKKELQCNIVNWGVPQGSEERILYELKKTKKLDVAIIFHSDPRYVFLPKCNRDVSIINVPENKSKILWTEDDDDDVIKETSEDDFKNEFFSYGKIKEVFYETQNFVDCMHYYRQYLTDDNYQLVLNRYESAKLMIDTWCLAKCPKVIHIDTSHYTMPWFKFKSGIQAPEIDEICLNSRAINPNNISNEGNKVITTKLLEILKNNNYI